MTFTRGFILFLFCFVLGSISDQPALAFPKLKRGFEKEFQTHSLPTGGRLAFTVRIGKYQRLMVLDLETKKLGRLVDGPGNNFYPSWSPDGTMLAFTSDRDGQKEIYLAEFDGSNQRRMTFNDYDDDNPSWHPDGKSIVFYSEAAGRKHTALHLVNVESGDESLLVDRGGRDTTPRISPDGNSVAMSTNRFWPGWDICVWNLVGRNEKCLLEDTGSYSRPNWSSDGKQIVYAFGAGTSIDLGLWSKDTDRKKRITTMENREYDPIFAGKDNLHVIFVAEGETQNTYNIYSLALTKDRDRTPEPLLQAPYSTRYLSWTPMRTLKLEAERIKRQRKARGQ